LQVIHCVSSSQNKKKHNMNECLGNGVQPLFINVYSPS
jgi:hypothetical protein